MSWSEVYKINSDMTTPLNELIKNQGNAVVKSIRRGYSQAETAGGIVNVTLSDINPSKAMVLVNSRYTYHRFSEGTVQQAYLISISAAQATFASHSVPQNTVNNTQEPASFSWQIIEFY